MKKKHLITLISCSAAMFMILIALYAISPLTKGMYRGNFTRKFVPQSTLTQTKIVELPFNSYYIAGHSKQTIFLGNWTNPFHMIMINTVTLDSSHYILKTNGIKYTDIERFRLKVDSPNFYLTHGTMPAILRGQLSSLNASRFMNDSAFFSHAQPISRSSFILRSYSSNQKSFELAKETNDSTKFKFNYSILEKQIDGTFCVEGDLIYDKESNDIIYVYRYRNQYSVMDTSLNLKFRQNTIDTFSHAPIQVVQTNNGNNKMLTGLPNVVNPISSASAKYLYVKSNVMSKDENVNSFVEGSDIDIYDTKLGKYLCTINIRNYNTSSLSDLKVQNTKLFMIYGKHLLIQTLDTTAFRQ